MTSLRQQCARSGLDQARDAAASVTSLELALHRPMPVHGPDVRRTRGHHDAGVLDSACQYCAGTVRYTRPHNNSRRIST